MTQPKLHLSTPSDLAQQSEALHLFFRHPHIFIQGPLSHVYCIHHGEDSKRSRVLSFAFPTMSSTTTSNPPSTWATLSRSPALSAETNWSIHHAESPPIALQYDRAHLNDCTGTHPCEHCDLGCTHSSSGRSTRSSVYHGWSYVGMML